MNVLYTVLTCFIVIIIYPVGFIMALFGRSQLLKRLNPPSHPPQDGSIRLWIHAASVGEAAIAFSMAGEIKKTYPDAVVFISTLTATGLERVHVMNESSGQVNVDCAFLAPVDCLLITRRFVNKIKPTSFILVETELWPALIQSLHNKTVPITVINGKLSKRAFKRYMLFRFIIKKIVRKISLICVQSKSFSRRFNMLGVPNERIEVIGNIKFDSLPDPSNYNEKNLRRDMGIPVNVKVFVAGSTRPGEEEVLVKSFVRVLKKNSDALMILAPRHLKRVPEIEMILHDNGLPFVKKTSVEKLDISGCRVLLLDTMGELISAFACADVAFVGGSLRDYGGHNPLEPAALSVPVLFGPYMEQTGSKELLSKSAALLVHDEDELAGMIVSLFNDKEKRQQMGKAGKMVVHRFKGMLARTLLCMKNRQLI